MPPMNHAPAESRRKGAPLPEQIAAAIEHVQRPERLAVVVWPREAGPARPTFPPGRNGVGITLVIRREITELPIEHVWRGASR